MKKSTKEAIIEKLNNSPVYDTRTYRYILHDTATRRELRRIRINRLGTTATLSLKSDTNPYGWTIVDVL